MRNLVSLSLLSIAIAGCSTSAPASSSSPSGEATVAPANDPTTQPTSQPTSQPSGHATGEHPSGGEHPKEHPAGGAAHGHGEQPHEKTPVERPDEKHLKNVKQLTFGGENAEAYFDQTGKELIFQSKREGMGCDQIFRIGADGNNERKVSVGDGRTTCSYILPNGKIVYGSTHGVGPGCLDEPDRSQGYVWKIYPEFDIWIADGDGKNAKVLFKSAGYDAEATACHKDGRILFTSSGKGDLDLYMMNADGSNVVQLTNTPGYDGGAFFSEDCTKVIWRASRPEGEDLKDYQRLLAQSLVRPSKLEIYVADLNKAGRLDNVVQVTKHGKASFAPYLHPDNKRLLYVSNKGDPKGREFDIYMVNVDGTGEETITTNPTFDGFPMWTPDGKKLVFASNRANAKTGETNVFIADWVD